MDTIVPNGAAEKDGRLRHGDIILAVDGVNVVDASHKKVISLMIDAGGNGQVTLRIRRKTESSSEYSFDHDINRAIVPLGIRV